MTGLEHVPTIVRLTLFEALRRRTLWALVLLTAVIVVLTGLGFEYLVTQARERGTGELRLQLGVSQVLILCAFMFSFILATTAAFLSAPAIAGDVESGVLLAMLARPLGRGTLVVGRWIGLAIVVVAYGAGAGLLEIAAMRLASGYGPPDRPRGGRRAGRRGPHRPDGHPPAEQPDPGHRQRRRRGRALRARLGGRRPRRRRHRAAGSTRSAAVGTVVRLVFPTDGLWRAAIFALEPPAVIAAITARSVGRDPPGQPVLRGDRPEPRLPRLVPRLGARDPRPDRPVVPPPRALSRATQDAGGPRVRPGCRWAGLALWCRALECGKVVPDVTDPTVRRRRSGVLIRTAAATMLALAALLPVGASLAPIAEAAAPNGPKVVIVAGPVGVHNRHYKADADALAKVARKYTRNVVLIKTPHATWPAVKAAAQGASIFVYLGHGNGWPSKYRDYLWPFTQNGLGLDPVSGADGSAHVYYGEAQVASEIRFAPNAVVLLFHLCYASGNTEPGLPTGTLADKKARTDNYGAGFFAAGARAVVADAYDANTPYMSRLFTSTATLDKLFHAVPTYHGHDIAWDSFRSTGARIIMDPTSIAKGPYYHSIVYAPGLTAKLVTRTDYRPTDRAPAALTIPGAASPRSATDLFADPALTSPAGTLAGGSRLRLLSEAPPLADGTRVVEVRTLDGAVAGFVRADALAPADSTPARLDTYDRPGALVGPNGDYVFDTFRVIVRASEPLDGTVTVRNDAGDTVKTLTATDAWSVFDWDLQDAGGTLVPDGRYSWSYSGTEPWGNNPAPFTRSGSFVLDATDPTTGASVGGTLDPSGWYSTAATVRLTARDALSGMRATYYRLDGGRKTRYVGPVEIARSGDHELDYWSVDQAGNVERTRTVRVKVDVTAPVTKAVLDGPAGEPGFFRDDVTVGLDPADAQSGVASSEIGLDGAPLAAYDGPIVVAAPGTHEVAFRSTDVTGRREKTKTVTFTIDRTAPTLGDPAAVAPAAVQFSPNGDGLADTVAVSHALTERGAIRLVVTPAGGGAAVRTVTIPVVKAGPGSIGWDGRADDGGYVPDGDYALTLIPLDRARNAGPSQAVTVAVFGAFVGLAPSPARFYPQDGDTLAGQSGATFRLKRGATVVLKVLNAKGVIVRTITDTFPAGPVSLAWDGRTDAGGFAPQGAYRYVVRVSAGGRSETHTTAVRAAAFELKPSVLSPRRGGKLKVTIVTAEPLTGKPRLTVRQPGVRVYAVKLTKIGASTYRATWTLRAGGRSGKLTLSVSGTDRLGGRNATSLSLHIR